MTLTIKILTPQRPFWSGEVDELILSTETGEMGVLNNHAPVITGLDVGPMMLRSKGEWKAFTVLGGFALVKNNQVTVLANEAEESASMDPEKTKMELESAKSSLENALEAKDKVEANFNYKRAKARFQVLKVMNKLS
jgi:F-type H+-transporting ATPase subunit epsilon